MADGLTTNPATGIVSAPDPIQSIIGNSKGVMDLITAITGSKTQNSSNVNTIASGASAKTSPIAIDNLQKLLPDAFSKAISGDFSKAAAQRDAMGGVQMLFRNLKEQALPQIFMSEAASGGYDSTVRNLLTNDAASRTAAAGQALISETATRYAGIESQRQQNYIAAINAAINAQQMTEEQKQSNVATIGDNTNKGLVSNPAFQAIAAALLAKGYAPAAIDAIAKLLGVGNYGSGDTGESLLTPETPGGIDMGPDIGVVLPGDPGYPEEQPWDITPPPPDDWVSQG